MRQKKKDDTDWVWKILKKKRKMGGAIAIIVFKTSWHSKIPILGTLGAMFFFRSLYAPKNSRNLELLFPLQDICLFNFPSKYIFRIFTNSKKLTFIANSPEGEQRLELLQLVVGNAEIK